MSNIINIAKNSNQQQSIYQHQEFVDKVNGILKRSYDAELRIQDINDIDDDMAVQLQDKDSLFFKDSWFFSLSSISSTSASLILSIDFKKELITEKQNSLKSFLECTAMLYFKQKDHLEGLRSAEEHIDIDVNSNSIAASKPRKTISFVAHSSRLKKEQQTSEQIQTEERRHSISGFLSPNDSLYHSSKFQKASKKLKLSNLPITLEHPDSHIIFQTALHVHQSSDRQSFLSFDHLDLEVRQDINALASLNKVTLLVDDLRKCSQGEISTLTSYIQSLSLNSEQGPGFIIGLPTSKEEILKTTAITTKQLQAIIQFHINLSQHKDLSASKVSVVQQLIALLSFEAMTALPV